MTVASWIRGHPRSVSITSDRLVIMFAGTPWHAARMPDQHMAECLSAYVPVLYVDPPASWLTGIRNPAVRRDFGGPRLLLEGKDLVRYRPLAPPGARRTGIRRVSGAMMRAGVRSSIRRLGVRNVDAIIAASLADVLNTCDTRRRVLYGTDDFVAGSELMNISDAWMSAREAAQLRSADLVVAVSDTLADRWRGMGAQTVTITNGCDYESFEGTDDAPLPTDVNLPGPIAGFIGHMSDRIDVDLLEGVARSGHSLLLVGPLQHTFDVRRLNKLLARPNVRYVGEKPFGILPSYMRLIHTGLVPYRDTTFNRASSPLKTLEYLAAGRSVVTTDLPASRALATPEVRISASPEQFVALVSASLAEVNTDELKARRQAVALRHSWRSKALDMAEALDLVPGH